NGAADLRPAGRPPPGHQPRAGPRESPLPKALLDRLDQRLPVLTGGARDVPDRQRTLRDTITWSYELLDETEQMLFSRLGVFVGGFTLEAAEQVSGADLDTVASLVEKSLVRLGEGRFRRPEPLRHSA